MPDEREEQTEVVMEPLTDEDLEDVAGGACIDGRYCAAGDGCRDGGESEPPPI